MKSLRTLENTLRQMKTYQNLRDTVKAVRGGKFIVVNAYINRRSQINNLPLNLKEPEKEKQIKGRKEGKKTAQINMGGGEQQRIDKIKSQFFENITKLTTFQLD